MYFIYIIVKNIDKNKLLNILNRMCRIFIKPFNYILYINYNQKYNNDFYDFLINLIHLLIDHQIFICSELSEIFLECLHAYVEYGKTLNNSKDKFVELSETIIECMESHYFDETYERYGILKYISITLINVYHDKELSDNYWNKLGTLFNNSTYFWVEYLTWLKTQNNGIEKCKEVIESINANIQLDDYKTYFDFWKIFEYEYGDFDSVIKFHIYTQPYYDEWIIQTINAAKQAEEDKNKEHSKKDKKNKEKSKKEKPKKDSKKKQPKKEQTKNNKMEEDKPQEQQEDKPQDQIEKKTNKRKLSDSSDKPSKKIKSEVYYLFLETRR